MTSRDSDRFGKRPLLIDAFYGLRYFNVDATGQLVGPVYRQTWTAGTNTATCMATGRSIRAVLSGEPNWAHELLSMDCSCGFYAYFDTSDNVDQRRFCKPDNEDGKGLTVTAVIKAWGRMVVGEYGFRAEKAEVVGLVRPAGDRRVPGVVSTLTVGHNGQLVPFNAIAARYPRVPVFASIAAALAAFPLSSPPDLGGE